MGRRAHCVLLACALLLAGCSGFSGGGSEAGIGADGVGAEGKESDGGVADVTPAPVPPVETEGQLAPGLTEAGVESPSALAVAHNTVLRNRSFTMRTNRTTTYANGSFRGRTIELAQVAPDEAAFGATYRVEGVPVTSRTDEFPVVRSERWFDGRRALIASTYTNSTTRYYRQSADAGSLALRSLVDDGGRYARLLDGAETRVVGRIERDGETVYRLAATDLSAVLAQVPWVESVRDTSFDALVSSRGFVRAYRLSYTATIEHGSTLRVTESTRYTALGETTVSRPSWYDEALNRTNATDSR